MKLANVAASVKSAKAQELLKQMYGANRVEANAKRYKMVAEGFVEKFGNKEFDFFSAPGRTEIGGNHTDHNHGKVLAGKSAKKEKTGYARLGADRQRDQNSSCGIYECVQISRKALYR